jgi:ribonuclease HII
MDEMWVPQSVAVAFALMLAASTLAQAASRRDRSVKSHNNSYTAYGTAYPASPPAAAGSSGGYSTDPHTRALEQLADKYRSGW